jgi:hypothetical protein
VAENSHCYHIPCLHSPVEGGGRGYYLYGPEDLLNKNVNYTYIIIKSILKMTFLMKTSET